MNDPLSPVTANNHLLLDSLICAWGIIAGLFAWLDGFALPHFILWGSALLLAWRFYVAWRDRGRPDKSAGTDL